MLNYSWSLFDARSNRPHKKESSNKTFSQVTDKKPAKLKTMPSEREKLGREYKKMLKVIESAEKERLWIQMTLVVLECNQSTVLTPSYREKKKRQYDAYSMRIELAQNRIKELKRIVREEMGFTQSAVDAAMGA